MQASFFKRSVAYIIDIIIVNILLSIVTIGLSANNDYSERMTELTNQYTSNEITYTELYTEYNKLSYESQKDNYISYILELGITLAYFIGFQGLNKGQTLGKKLMKIQVVKDTDEEVEMKDIIIRTIPLYSIVSLLTLCILIKIINMNTYNNIYNAITSVEAVFTLITMLFILYRKDKRGLHDIIAKTKVVVK